MSSSTRNWRQRRIGWPQMDGKIDELKHEMQAFRTHLIGIQQDIIGIHSILARHEQRLDRIERRLELSEVPMA